MDKNTQKAWRIGSFCIATYLASYVTRNILSVSTPEMIKEAFFTKEYTGLLSSICFIFYAAGQLINGFIGDRVHPKYDRRPESEAKYSGHPDVLFQSHQTE